MLNLKFHWVGGGGWQFKLKLTQQSWSWTLGWAWQLVLFRSGWVGGLVGWVGGEMKNKAKLSHKFSGIWAWAEPMILKNVSLFSVSKEIWSLKNSLKFNLVWYTSVGVLSSLVSVSNNNNNISGLCLFIKTNPVTNNVIKTWFVGPQLGPWSKKNRHENDWLLAVFHY